MATEALRREADDDGWVLEALEPDQLVAGKTQRFGLRRLGLGTRVLMWALRGYVIFMLVVIVYQILNGGSGSS
jgi:hypothetical protein